MSFEPNPAVFAQLEAHATLNGFGARVTAMQMALSDAPDAAARLFVSQQRDNSGLSSLTPSEDTLKDGGLSAAHTIAVRVDTFDTWRAGAGLAHVDLLKSTSKARKPTSSPACGRRSPADTSTG